MTDFLVKRFVKNFEQTEDPKVRTRYGMMASMVGIWCNVILFGAKLIVGIILNSISVMADAFNNLSDAASSIVGFVGVRMAGKPADEEHPFGHGRIEYIAAFIVAFLVIQVGFSLLKTSVGKIFHPEVMTFSAVSVGILLGSVAVTLWLGLFNRKLGKKINSSVMLATAADSMGDVGATSATILSLFVYGISGVNIDGIVGTIVSLLVLWAGVNIAKDTLAPLIGEPVDRDVYQKITEFVESYPGILGSHDLIVHNYGPSRSMASIHAEVSNTDGMEEAHELIDTIERDASRKFGLFLVIHMDPVETKDVRVRELRTMMEEILNQADSQLSLHDFRVVDGKEHINLIFDLVVPRYYTNRKKEEVKDLIVKLTAQRDSRITLVMTAESSYCAE